MPEVVREISAVFRFYPDSRGDIRMIHNGHSRLDGFVNLEAAMPIVDHADIAPRIGIEAKHRRDLPYHFRHRPASGHSRTSRAPAAPASALRPWRALPARGRAHDSADRC